MWARGRAVDLASDVAWLRAMVEVEVALAAASAEAGFIPASHASVIESASKGLVIDMAAIAQEASDDGYARGGLGGKTPGRSRIRDRRFSPPWRDESGRRRYREHGRRVQRRRGHRERPRGCSGRRREACSGPSNDAYRRPDTAAAGGPNDLRFEGGELGGRHRPGRGPPRGHTGDRARGATWRSCRQPCRTLEVRARRSRSGWLFALDCSSP